MDTPNGPARLDSLTTTDHPVSDAVITPPRWWYGRRFVNILLLSFGIMFITTVDSTTTSISNNVIHDMKEYGFVEGDGYISLAISYLLQLVVSLTTPSVIKMTSGKWAVFAGGVAQLIYVTAFQFQSRLLLFIASGVFGVGLSWFYSANGVVFTANSGATTADKYSAVYSVIVNFAEIWGNLVVTWKFGSVDVIDDSTRRITFGALMAMAATGLAVLFFIEQPEPNKVIASFPAASSASNVTEIPVAVDSKMNMNRRLWLQVRTTSKLITSWPMLLCLGFFIFQGLKLTIVGSPIATAIGFNKHFGDARKQLIGISGVCFGAAGISTAIFLILFTNYISRTIVFFGGVLLCAMGVGINALNMPLNSTVEDSNEPSIFFGDGPSSVTICIVGAVLCGIGDTATTAPIIAIISDVFGHEHDVVVGVDNKAIDSELATISDEVACCGSSHRPKLSTCNSVCGKCNISKMDGVGAEATEQAALYNDYESTATAFAVLNGCQALVSVFVFFLTGYIWLQWYIYIFVPICVWACIVFYIVERNFRAGRYRNYFRGF